MNLPRPAEVCIQSFVAGVALEITSMIMTTLVGSAGVTKLKMDTGTQKKSSQVRDILG